MSGRDDQEALEFGFDLVQVYVFDDSATARDAADEAADEVEDVEQEANVVWTTGGGGIPPEVTSGIRNCIGEAS